MASTVWLDVDSSNGRYMVWKAEYGMKGEMLCGMAANTLTTRGMYVDDTDRRAPSAVGSVASKSGSVSIKPHCTASCLEIWEQLEYCEACKIISS